MDGIHMKSPNAQLEAMLRDFESRPSVGTDRAAQLRAAVESNELTLRTFNDAAAAGTIRSFEIDTEKHGKNHVGRVDPERGSVSLPHDAFRQAGAAPTLDLIATCRVQSMIASFVSGSASPEMATNLQKTVNESPFLASEIKRAATTRDLSSPRHFGLEKFELLPPNANVGGAYDGSTHSISLPADALIAHPRRAFDQTALTFVVGHEIQHAFNRADALRATLHFNEGVHRVARSASPVHDYTEVIAKYLGEVRKDEAAGQIAGWNAVRSGLEASGKQVTLEVLGKADNRMRDFVPFKVDGSPASTHPDIVLNADLTISPTPGNIEALGKHYFDRPPRDHFPPESKERIMGLNYDHVSNYPNHYGKYAIEQILAVEEKAPLFHGKRPEITFDMARLGLYEDVLERQGLDLRKSHPRVQYFDSSQLPSTPHHFEHTAEGRGAHKYVPIAPEGAPVLPPRLDHPAHPDHEFFQQVRGHVVELDRSLGRGPDHYTDNIASALTVQARADGLQRVDRIELSVGGDTLRGAQLLPGRNGQPPALSTSVATSEANTPMERSAERWPEAMLQFEGQERARAANQNRSHALNDPRHPDHRDRALYGELERRLPDSSEERLMQFTAACHRHRITAGKLSEIHVDYDRMTVSFDSHDFMSTPATVDLSAPPPEAEQSIQRIEQFDQQMAQIFQESRDRTAQMSQQGPVM
jgi:hypothetical protein